MLGTVLDHIRLVTSFDSLSLIIYASMIVLSSLCCVKYDIDRAKGKDSIAWIMIGFVFVWIVMGASKVSGDYPNYVAMFHDSTSLSSYPRIERLFIFLNWLVRLFTDSFEVFNFIRAGLFLSLVCLSLLLFRKEIYTSIFMFCFSGVYVIESQNFMRTYLSAAICFVALYYLFNKKIIPYLVLVAVSFFIHRGTVVMLVPFAYYVLILLFPKRKWWHYALVAAVTIVFVAVALHFRDFIFARDTLFSNTYHGVQEGGKLGIACFIYVLPLVVLFVLYFFEDYYDQNWQDFSFVMMICAFCVDVVAYYVLGIGRMWTYFFPAYGVCASYYLYKGVTSSKRKRLYIVGLVLYVLFIALRTLIQTEYFYPYGIMPYISVFHG